MELEYFCEAYVNFVSFKRYCTFYKQNTASVQLNLLNCINMWF